MQIPNIKMDDPSRRRHGGHRSRVRPRASLDVFDSSASAGAAVEEPPSPMSCCLSSSGGGSMTGGSGSTNRQKERQQRRGRHVQATLSAFLGLCALIVLSGDLIHLPTFHTTLSTLMSSARRRLAEDSSASTTSADELIPVTGVRTATFFLPVEPHLKYNNKMNAHFTLPQYSQGLANTCQFLTKLDHPAYVLGDQTFVRERAGPCGELNSQEGGRYEMEGLRHEEAASMVQRHMCRRKFATDKHDPR